jgi:signal transduction histidine kinase
VITVAADVERVELEVRDDGAGFEEARRSAALREGHIGLASAEQRVRALGGELEIDSAPGGGTTVRALLPLNLIGSAARRTASWRPERRLAR